MEIDWTAAAAALSSMMAPLTGIAGVLVGHWLSSGHSRKEKINDLRRVAYGGILSELSAAQYSYDAAASNIAENSHGYHASDLWDQQSDRIFAHMTKARQRFTDDYLVLSDAFISRWEVMMNAKETVSNRDPDDPFVNVEEHGKIVQAARVDLMKIARTEIPA